MTAFARKFRGLRYIGAASALLYLASCASTAEPPADPVLEQASTAMGAGAVRSLRYTATGTGASYGQAHLPNVQWPRLNYSQFVRLADYEAGALREEFARSRAEPHGGGALPLMGEGEQRAVGLLRGEYAWNLAGLAPVPAPLAVDTRFHDLWTTPHGVLKAATLNRARSERVNEGGQVYGVLSFAEQGRFSARAFVNAQGLVERVESRLPNPVLGESSVVTHYSDYRDHGGVKFPARIRQSQEGVTVLDLEVKEVQVNPPTSDIAVPELVRGFTERAVAEQAAAGVWFVAGGSHNSVAVDMGDHVVLVESPLYDARAAAMLAEVQRVLPGKPLRYVVNSHHHFDHAGGLRAAVAGGATLLTSAAAVPFFQQALARPSSIRPDALAISGKTGVVEGVSGKRVLEGAGRSIELHLITDSVHAIGFVMAYLPAEKILIQADAYTPGPPNAALPARPNANHLNLIDNIERLGLKVERILPLHGRMVALSELYAAAGKKLP